MENREAVAVQDVLQQIAVEEREADLSAQPPTARRRFTFFIKAAEAVQRTLTEPRLRQAGITYAQLAMLRSIAANPNLCAADLARHTSVTPQSAGEIISTLLRKHLVTRSEDAESRKTLRLNILPAGTHLLAKVESILDSVEADLIATIDSKDLEIARAVLGGIIEAAKLAPSGARRANAANDHDTGSKPSGSN